MWARGTSGGQVCRDPEVTGPPKTLQGKSLWGHQRVCGDTEVCEREIQIPELGTLGRTGPPSRGQQGDMDI